jgi:hypothetical protein
LDPESLIKVVVSAGNAAANHCGRFFMRALPLLFLSFTGAAGQPAVAAPGTSAGFAVALSENCLLTSLRMPDLTSIASLRVGQCPSAVVAKAHEKAEIYLGTAGGELMSIALPALSIRQRLTVDGRVVRIFVPQMAPYLIAEVAVQGGPSQLWVIDTTTWSVLRRLPLQDRQGSGWALSRMIESPSRKSLLVSFENVPELWELFMGADAPVVFEGLVHDYRLGEGIRESEILPLRRISLEAPLIDFQVERAGPHVLIRYRDKSGHLVASRFNLDVRRPVAMLDGTAQVGHGLENEADGVAPFVNRCRVLLEDAARVFLGACRDNDAGTLFVVDVASRRLEAMLEPGPATDIGFIVSDRDSKSLLVITERSKLVAYRVGAWCRTGEWAGRQVSGVWVYP